jgi:hypothetical protein
MAGIAPDPVLLTLWERGRGATPVECAAALLDALPDTGADLDVGSRDVLLARLLAAVAGPLVWARAACSSCGTALDVPVDVAAVAALPVHAPGEGLTVEVDGAPVGFRLPTTGDLLALRNVVPEVARDLLLRRCLALPDDAGPVPEAVADVVDAAMEAAAPAGAIDLLLTCTDCATTSAVALDVPLLLWVEVEACAATLMAQVHALAAAYGWTEPDVLALSPRRRAAYLELVES